MNSGGGRFEKPAEAAVDEDAFEDVGLNDDTKPKKKGFLGRLADSAGNSTPSAPDGQARPASSHGRFHLPGRKRGQSGQGAELGDMPDPRPASKGLAVERVKRDGADGVVR